MSSSLMNPRTGSTPRTRIQLPEPGIQHAAKADCRLKLFLGSASLSMVTAIPPSAAAAILIPAKIGIIAADDKVMAFALVAMAAAVAEFALVKLRSVSEARRSVWGNHTSWAVGGSLLSAIAMVMLASATTLPTLLLWACTTQMGLSTLLAMTTAAAHYRIPATRLGPASAAIGVGQLLGTSLGMVGGSAFIGKPDCGLVLLAGIPFATAALLLALLEREQTNAAGSRISRTAVGLLQTFAHPAGSKGSYWTLTARLLLLMGTGMIWTCPTQVGQCWS